MIDQFKQIEMLRDFLFSVMDRETENVNRVIESLVRCDMDEIKQVKNILEVGVRRIERVANCGCIDESKGYHVQV